MRHGSAPEGLHYREFAAAARSVRAHMEKDRIRATYNKSLLMDERLDMMHASSNYLDALAAGGDVVPIRRAAAGFTAAVMADRATLNRARDPLQPSMDADFFRASRGTLSHRRRERHALF